MELNLIRYNNRKLYNPETSRYTNFSEIRAVLENGHSVRVIDHTTRNDLTDRVLLEMYIKQKRDSSIDRATILNLLGIKHADNTN